MVLLVLGLGCALSIWIFQPASAQAENRDNRFLSPQDSARYERQLEIYYGKFGVLTDRWTRSLAEFTHGRRLFMVLAAVSIAGAGFCLGVSHLIARSLRLPPPQEK